MILEGPTADTTYELLVLNQQIADIKAALTKLAAKELPAPVVNVSSPEVAVAGTDLTPLLEALSGLSGPVTLPDNSDVLGALAALRTELSELGESLRHIVGSIPSVGSGSSYVTTEPATGHTWPVSFDGGVTISGGVEVSNDAGNPLPVNGTVSVGNFPATQAVTGPLTDAQLRASAVSVVETEPTVLVAVATTASPGDNTVLAVAADKRLRLRWISCQSDPEATDTPLIKVLIGTDEKYRSYGVVQHKQLLDGSALGDDLIVNVSDGTAVVVTAHYQLLDV